MLIDNQFEDNVCIMTLNDPERRNALSYQMIRSIDEDLTRMSKWFEDIPVLVLCGAGRAFCSGFDLAAAVEKPNDMAEMIRELSQVLRSLRRLPQVVIGAVHGAAIAGGCALVSACDLVVVSRTTQLGYPVHRIGVSPAVTIPTLSQKIWPGAARALTMGGELIDGEAALKLGLATQLVESDAEVLAAAKSLARRIASHGPNALRVTKRWLNELDGSDQDSLFDPPAEDSARYAWRDEAVSMLRAYWTERQAGRGR